MDGGTFITLVSLDKHIIGLDCSSSQFSRKVDDGRRSLNERGVIKCTTLEAPDPQDNKGMLELCVSLIDIFSEKVLPNDSSA
jgi:hypothetical protein